MLEELRTEMTALRSERDNLARTNEVLQSRARKPDFTNIPSRLKDLVASGADVNKGDGSHPNYRNHFVAPEIRRKGENPIFAPTPPLESLRTILSLTATRDY